MAEIQDFGEKIGGAKKDLYKTRAMTIKDLQGIDTADFETLIIKDNIWHTPDYTSYKGTMDNCCIYYMKFVRDHIKAKTDVTSYSEESTRKAAELYIKFVTTMKEFCESLKTKDDLYNLKQTMFKSYKNEQGVWTEEAIYTPGLDNTFVNTVLLSKREVDYIIEECDIQGFPDSFRGDLKGIRIRETYGHKFKITNNSKYLTDKEFNTRQEALDYAKSGLIEELDDKKKTRKSSTLVNIVRPQLEYIERIGPNIRHNVDVTTDNILDYFKFRGGEFGNWNSQKDRQAYLNYIFDSLVDLVYVLKSPVDFIGLGKDDKRLAIAFGARGKGGALAHYEPDRVVINLTKMKGAGSLAHEWGHAFDDFLGSKHGYKGIRRYMSEHIKINKPENSKTANAMIELIATIYRREYTNEEIEEERKATIEKEIKTNTFKMTSARKLVEQALNSGIESLEDTDKKEELRDKIQKLQGISNEAFYDISSDIIDEVANVINKRYFGINAKIDARTVSQCADAVNKYKSGEKTVEIPKINKSRFLRCASKLDKGRKEAYYSSSVEMFARIFESYIEDKLVENGLTSQYLVHSTLSNDVYGEYKPYPYGYERKLFDGLMEKIIAAAIEEFGSDYNNRIGLNDIYKQDKVSYRQSIKIEKVKDTTAKTKKSQADNTEDNKQISTKQVANQQAVSQQAVSQSTKQTGIENQINSTQDLKKQLTSVFNTSDKIDDSKCMRYMDCLAIIGKAKLGYGYIGLYDISKLKLPESNSKAYLDTMTPQKGRVIFVATKAKPEKQLEGLTEAFVNRVVTDKYGNSSAAKMIVEGVTYTMCKRFGLDVRTYCLSDKFEALVKAKDQIKSYLDICSNMYTEIMNMLTK